MVYIQGDGGEVKSGGQVENFRLIKSGSVLTEQWKTTKKKLSEKYMRCSEEK
jgi:hypothetical protein